MIDARVWREMPVKAFLGVSHPQQDRHPRKHGSRVGGTVSVWDVPLNSLKFAAAQFRKEVKGMDFTRREFLVISGVIGAGVAASNLGLDLRPVKAYADELKIDKLKTAKNSTTICPYCSVSCGLIVSTDTKTGKIINIEGDPDHPINEGALCAKGAALYQTTANNSHRLTKVLYRAPFSEKWEEKTWDWAINEIAKKVKSTRDADFIEKNGKGQVVNRVETIAHLGSSNIDNEECAALNTMVRSLGLVYIDHQARI